MKILEKNILAISGKTRIIQLKIFSPEIASKAKPGQFIVLILKEEGERIPLTVVDTDLKSGSITLIFQEAGLTTTFLGGLNPGDSLYALVGPLGHPTEIKKYGRIILVGGGVGIAEIYPVAKALKNIGNHITSILGVRTKALLILEKELSTVSDEFFVTTDDGSYGKKGFVTDVLKELLETSQPSTINYQLIYAVGPIPMMRRVTEVTKFYNVESVVSLNTLMVDATGMCGCCRVTVGGEVKFSCIDGPEFPGNLVNWDELEKRNRMYEDKEKEICRFYNI